MDKEVTTDSAMETILLLANSEPDGSLAKPALEALGAAKTVSAGLPGSKLIVGLVGQTAQTAADSIEELSELHSTSGQYDLLGKFYLEPAQDIGLFVTERIQTLPGVKDTHTLITFNAFVGGHP